MKTNQNIEEYDFIIGLDEVGRGAIAGPVTVGAVCISASTYKDMSWDNLKDSKKLTPKKREEWCEYINNNFDKITYSISAKEVDKNGIISAITKCADECIKKLIKGKSMYLILADYGLPVDAKYDFQNIVKGDEKEPIIAFASIWAKVNRDTYMSNLDIPKEYMIEKNKGYGTQSHREAIEQIGLTKHHRKTFCSNIGGVI